MQLELAAVLSCAESRCLVQVLDAVTTVDAYYSDPMLEHGIVAHPGQLVTIDTSVAPARIVYRYPNMAVVGANKRTAPAPSRPMRLIRDGRPVDAEQLRDETFPSIRAIYARQKAAEDVDPKQVVQRGYDRIAERYLAWAEKDTSGLRQRYADELLRELPQGAAVLELGCGAGVPVTRALSRRFEVTGVDLSARQIALAREHVPQTRLIQADIADLDLPPGSYDGVAAFYVLFHVPREQQPKLLRNIASWLRPGGLLVGTMGTQASRGDVDDDWLGAPMYWSSYDSETNVRLVRKAGLEVLQACEETVEEHGEQVTFLWVVARK
jgi:SAM-dependent methyltransferase